MINNCRTFFEHPDGTLEAHDYHDPYLFEVNGRPFIWTGSQLTHPDGRKTGPWINATTCGYSFAIPGTLKKVTPRDELDPPPGFRRI